MGIDIASLGKGPNAALTPLQAHSRYLPIGRGEYKMQM